MPKIPSIFYHKFKEQLLKKMVFVDLKNNMIQVILGKVLMATYIMAYYETLVGFYGLRWGGWMKIIYVGGDVFVILSVKDSNKTRVATPEPAIKILLPEAHVMDLINLHNQYSNKQHKLNPMVQGFIGVQADAVGQNGLMNPPVKEVPPTMALRLGNFRPATTDGSNACCFYPGLSRCRWQVNRIDPNRQLAIIAKVKKGYSSKVDRYPLWDPGLIQRTL
ncbi:hypothetical protein PIB30_067382 [Stylosanthes scabra]|uniref:Uncharacterized protein n=1 Tax=Stylosanthes scabra TaxID=79078 RepID=A0ABU6WMI4_9FABA|nr:hypothetical protein [Stylosanthes scabra]